ncbi:MAG: tRNA (adenosine(37)-N6)-dimethylallyltransferase MiaA [Pseudobutyrivibrio sp.]|nr:tRNA (adenosine(37)-N6)-dimethylallyltransferase MiaA [Pseudobutyrivibrio sp.]
MKQPLVILTGPTAVGKTALSIELAKLINGEIISADCMQVYKRMDVGSAKITPDEMDGVKHHLIDIMEPSESFDVVLFKELAEAAIKDISDRGHIPIICGGTGFYIQALLYDIDFTLDTSSKSLREEFESFADVNGNEALWQKLYEMDVEAANQIPFNNRRKVVRALEYITLTGESFSEHNKTQRMKESAYNHAYFVITDEREKLYERINKRVDVMIENGLLKEVKGLMAENLDLDSQAMKGIGYQEIAQYLCDNCSYEEAVELIKQNSRHYAKRQLTWFRRERDVIWLDKSKLENKDDMLSVINNELLTRGIISERII